MIVAFPQHKWQLEAGYWSNWIAGDVEGIARSLRSLGDYAALLDMNERYFLDTIRVIFQEQWLARGTWQVGTRLVRPQVLSSLALCTIEGDRDNVTGAGQTHAAHALFGAMPGARRRKFTIADCDHYGLFTGRQWRDTIHPALMQFWNSVPVPTSVQSSNPTRCSTRT